MANGFWIERGAYRDEKIRGDAEVTLQTVQLVSVIHEAKPGFASGDDLDEGVFQIRMNNITRDGGLDLTKKRRVRVDGKKTDGLFVEVGDVLFNATNSPDLVGKSTYIGSLSEPTTFSNHFIRLRTNSEKLDGGYLARWLHTQFQAGRFKELCRQWVNQATVSREALLGLEIPLLPLPEQRRIAAILDQADTLRAKRREALALLDSLAQSIFIEMFGDPITNPKGWPIRVIGNLLESASYGTSEKSSTTGQFPVLRMNNITRTGEIDFSDLKYMDLDEADYERYLVKQGDILFNRTNSAELVGKTAIFREAKPIAYAGYLIRLRTNTDNDPEYLAGFLNTAYAKKILRGMCKSIIGMANINATELQTIKIRHVPK